MTLIIGVKCEDGIVIGADSIVTYGSAIEQEVSDKIEVQSGDVIVAIAGEVGLSQLIKDELCYSWDQVKKERRKSNIMTAISQAMLLQILPAMERANLGEQDFGGCDSMIALPFVDSPILLAYTRVADPIEITIDATFASIGSGAFQADPFLAFVKRTFWHDQAPRNTSEGIFGVLWTLDHVAKVNAGLGIGGRSRIAVLRKQGEDWKAVKLSDDHLAEHRLVIDDAEDILRKYRNRFNPAVNGDTS